MPEELYNRKLWNHAALMTVATTLALSLMGQPLWCKCGSWIPWSWDIWSSHNSQHLFDPYTASHVLHGVIFCGMLYWLPRSVSESTRFLQLWHSNAAGRYLKTRP